MEASDKGYLGIQMYDDYSHKQVPTVIQEQQKELSRALSQFPEYADMDASKGFVELVSTLNRFKHLNMNTLAAALIYKKRYGFNFKDLNNTKFGSVMVSFGFPWHDEKGNEKVCLSCRRREDLDKNTPWCIQCVKKFLDYKLDVIRYLRMLQDADELFEE
jgi:hypothetical protein